MANPPDVLLVEDDPILKAQLLAALNTRELSVESTGSIQDALLHIQTHAPKIIVCDVRLPDGDGRDLLEAVRRETELKFVQFVLMTGYHDDAPQRTGMDLGADDYLSKPFNMQDFLSCIDARMQRSSFWKKTMESEAAGQLKGLTSLTLPHEFFTPLAGILGLSELLRQDLRESVPPDVLESLDQIHQSAERLHRTLGNYLFILQILDRSSPRATRTSLCELAGLCPVLNATSQMVAQRHERQPDLTLTCDIEVDERKIPVLGSEIIKIADELLDNAFKFSAAGQPVEVQLMESESNLFLSVRDHGRGLTHKQVEEIGAFKQFDRTRFEQQGLGLGLTIAQHLVEGSQGQLSIECERQGTRVTVRWPILS